MSETLDLFGAPAASGKRGEHSAPEDPDGFNRIVGEFLGKVERERWPERDPRAISATVTGIGPKYKRPFFLQKKTKPEHYAAW